MIIRQLVALIAKDLRVFFADRQALVLSFAAPIALASFMATVFGGAGPSVQSRIPILLVDEDGGTTSAAIVAGARSDPRLRAESVPRGTALAALRKGEVALAVVIPRGFGEAAADALVGDGPSPELRYLEDPTRRPEASLAEGLLTRVVLEAVSAESFGDLGADPLGDLAGSLSPVVPDEKGPGDDSVDRAEFLALFDRTDDPVGGPSRAEGREELLDAFPGLARWFEPDKPTQAPAPAGRGSGKGLTMPFVGRSESIIAGGAEGERGALAAHAFAGMIVQFVLFSAVEWGVGLLVERERGLWKRIRVAPVSRATLLAAKVLGSLVASLLIVAVVFGFGAATFGIRVRGDFAGFLLVAASFGWMAANFGLMVAALGRSPRGARSVSILAVLAMVMLGGGWIPGFLFPAWLQAVTPAIPARWAIDGFDGRAVPRLHARRGLPDGVRVPRLRRRVRGRGPRLVPLGRAVLIDLRREIAGPQAGLSPVARSATNSPISRTTSARCLDPAPARRRTRALPTIRPSATGESSRICSAPPIPKPMQIGRSVWPRSQATFSASSGGRLRRSPVIPATDT